MKIETQHKKVAEILAEIPEKEAYYPFEYIDSIIPPTRAYKDPRPSITALYNYMENVYDHGGLIPTQRIGEIDENIRTLHKKQIENLVDVFTENNLKSKLLRFRQAYKETKHLFTIQFTDLVAANRWCYWSGGRGYKGNDVFMDSLFGVVVEHNDKICLKISFEPDILNNSLLVCQIQGGEDARSVEGFMDLNKSAISIIQEIARRSGFGFVDVVSSQFHERYTNPDHTQYHKDHTTTTENLDKQYISKPRMVGLELFLPKISQQEKKIRRRVYANFNLG
jgi:hypothetical protein